MKKINRFVAVLMALFALLALLAVPARAQSPVSRAFIGGNTDPNGATIPGFSGYLQTTLGQTNLFGQGATYARGTLITNLTVTITNPANSLIITGYVSQTIPNFVSNTAAISDVPLWANRDGTVPNCSISVDINGNGPFSTNGTTTAVGDPTFTNALTFTFAPIFGAPGYVAGAGGPPMGGTKVATWPGNSFSFQVSGNGTNDVYVSTNVPTGFLQGAIGLRLLSIISSPTAGNTNGQVVGVWLNGFQPGGGSVVMNGGENNNYAVAGPPKFIPLSVPPAAGQPKAVAVRARRQAAPIVRNPTRISLRVHPVRHLSELMILHRM